MITLLIICLIRALRFKTKRKTALPAEPVATDKEKAVKDLQALIRCRTVSHVGQKGDDQSEFDKLEDTLRSNYPNVFLKTTFTKLSSRAFLFCLPGRSEDKKHVSVLMAHFDVVDVTRENWKEDPFAGVIKDGELWGRGTIDTKGTLNGALCAADQLLAQGFVPEHDIYLCFAGDEEVNGGSAKLAVEYFAQNKLEPLIVLDEGGAVVEEVFPGVSKAVAAIGTAEKGAVALEFHIEGEGGHASAPKPHTPVGELAQIAVEMEKRPFPFRLTPAAKEMFSMVGREASLKYRIIYANLWLFAPLLNLLTKKTGGQLNALLRTTCALTMMQGSSASNVIPSEAMIGANLRLLPGEKVEDVAKKYQKIVDKLGVNAKVSFMYGWDPSRISTTEGQGYEKLSQAILGTWGEEKTVVSPYIMTACADARFWSAVSDKVYRFSAMKLSKEQIEMIHGDNERLSVQQVAETVEFYYRLEKTL